MQLSQSNTPVTTSPDIRPNNGCLNKVKIAPVNGINLYHGKHSDGSFRVVLNGKRAKLYGSAHELVSHNNTDGTTSTKRKLRRVTPGYSEAEKGTANFIAKCVKLGTQWRFIGDAKYCSEAANALVNIEPKIEKNSDLVVAASQVVATPAVQPDDSFELQLLTPIQQVSTGIKNQKKSERQLLAFKKEIQFIVAQRAVGIDPPVSITTACRMSNRSRAAAYRDMEKGLLPKPTKIGRSSSLPYSVVEAYAAGRLVGVEA